MASTDRQTGHGHSKVSGARGAGLNSCARGFKALFMARSFRANAKLLRALDLEFAISRACQLRPVRIAVPALANSSGSKPDFAGFIIILTVGKYSRGGKAVFAGSFRRRLFSGVFNTVVTSKNAGAICAVLWIESPYENAA